MDKTISDHAPTAAADPYGRLNAIMRRFGATCGAEEFYWAVNTSYHAAEAENYDEIHVDHMLSLKQLWLRLSQSMPPTRMEILDVGAGTGIVGQYLQDLCGDRIASMTHLDPSPAMIEKVKAKSSTWAFPSQFVTGDIRAIEGHARFDVITANSVLHHIVELEAFCRRVTELLKPGGVLLTAQDERSNFRADAVFNARLKAAQARRAPARKRSLFERALNWSKRKLFGHNVGPLAEATSRPLIERRIIRRKMDIGSIWAVTDFHVSGQPGGIGEGIERQDLQRWLAGTQCADYMTHRFQGMNWEHLKPDEQEAEIKWFNENDPHGQLFASAWRRS